MSTPLQTPVYADMHPDDYLRLHELARRRALELRQEAIREAPAWTARALVRAARAMARLVRRHAVALHFFHPKSNPRFKTPCQPLS